MTTTITAQAHGYSVTLTGSAISISRTGGEWVGDGRWQDGRIIDCAAQLGATPDETEAIYADLEDALGDAIDEQAEPWERVMLDDGSAEPGYIRECADGWEAKRGGDPKTFDSREEAIAGITITA